MLSCQHLDTYSEKTEVLFRWRRQLSKVTLVDLNVWDIIVGVQDVVKDLWVLRDSQMVMIKLQMCARHLHYLQNILKN